MTRRRGHEAGPEFVVTVKGNVTTWTFVKPQMDTRRTEEVTPDPVYRQRRIQTGKPPFDTPEARRNHELRRQYVSFWAQRACGVDMPFPDHLHDVTCGAKTRAGTLCKQRALYANARCKFHGGASTGPISVDGKRRSAENGKLRGRHVASEPHEAPIEGMLVTAPLTAPNSIGDSEPHGNPLITPTFERKARDTGDHTEALEDLTKPDIAPHQKPVAEPENTSVRERPTNMNQDWLAPWMSV